MVTMSEDCNSGEADAGRPPGRLFCPAQEDSRGGEKTLDCEAKSVG